MKFVNLKNYLLALAALFLINIVGCSPSTTVTPVETKYGAVQGILSDDGATIIYKGIPFAAPPVRELRWSAPIPPKKWEGVLLADKFSAASIQAPHVAPSQPLPDGEIDYVKEFFDEGDPEFSEDCLYLNIWTPADANPDSELPVAVWIHGGAFMAGFGFEKEMDGEAFANRDVILVTINYRLGPLGFAAHPSLTIDDSAGNYGLLDQIAAIDWVRDNIKSFGGDPNNITVFGQSAGAMSVRTLLSSPFTEGKIAKAIMQSGGGLMSVDPTMNLDDAEQHGVEVYGDLTAEQLRSLTTTQIDSLNAEWTQRTGQWMMLMPIKDGKVVKDNFTEKTLNGTLPDIPIMIGFTAQDMEIFRDSTNYAAFADALESVGHRAPYIYKFARQLPGDKCGAFHSSELWYVFGTLDRSWRPFEPQDYALSDKMIDSWTNFIKYGNPNRAHDNSWPPYNSESNYIQVFDAE